MLVPLAADDARGTCHFAVQNSDVKPMVIDRCGTMTNSEVEPLLERLEWAGRPQQAVAQIEFDATRRAIVMQPMRQVELGS